MNKRMPDSRRLFALASLVAALGIASARSAASQDWESYAKVIEAAEAGTPVQFQGGVSLRAGADSVVGALMLVPATASSGYTQGSPADPAEIGRDSDETPFTQVLTRPLVVMATEVTRRMWSHLQSLQPALGPDPTDVWHSSSLDDPVQSVDWYGAVLFGNLLSIQQGLEPCYYTDSAFTTPILTRADVTDSIYCKWTASGYRIPTEGEWEWLARAETTGPFSVVEPFYDAATAFSPGQGVLVELERIAWFCATASGGTRPAGQLDANPWGLKDVHGNVWEWCWDWYGTYPSTSQTDYTGPTSGSERVYRGGGWFNEPRVLRSANRLFGKPSAGYYNIGFRLVRLAN